MERARDAGHMDTADRRTGHLTLRSTARALAGLASASFLSSVDNRTNDNGFREYCAAIDGTAGDIALHRSSHPCLTGNKGLGIKKLAARRPPALFGMLFLRSGNIRPHPPSGDAE